MWSDNPVHSELTERSSHLLTDVNRYRVHKPTAPVSIPDTAAFPTHNVKSRPGRACDLCRRRKTKCDGPSAPDNVCSNCVQNNQSCSYLCAYMRILQSFRLSHLPLAKPLVQEVHQKRSSLSLSLPPLDSINSANATTSLQLCLWPRRPFGKDGGTAQEGMHQTNPSSLRPSELNLPSPSCVRRSISLGISDHPSSGIPGRRTHNR